MGGEVIVLDRPWWARLLGPNPATAIVIVVFGWVVPFAPLAALSGDLSAAGAILALGGSAWVLCALGWRIGVTVDDDGITVQNMVFRHRIPWTGIVRLELHGLGRTSNSTADVVRRPGRFGRPVEITALGNLGRVRRVAWIDQVAPVLADHGVPIVVPPESGGDWVGIQAPHEHYEGPRPSGPLWRQWWDRPVVPQDWTVVGVLCGVGALFVGSGVLGALSDRPWIGSVGFGAFLIGMAAFHIVPILMIARRRARRVVAPGQGGGLTVYL